MIIRCVKIIKMIRVFLYRLGVQLSFRLWLQLLFLEQLVQLVFSKRGGFCFYGRDMRFFGQVFLLESMNFIFVILSLQIVLFFQVLKVFFLEGFINRIYICSEGFKFYQNSFRLVNQLIFFVSIQMKGKVFLEIGLGRVRESVMKLICAFCRGVRF